MLSLTFVSPTTQGYFFPMIVFQVAEVRESGATGWAVQRIEPDGLTIMVSRIHSTREAAKREAASLNEKAARRTMS